ncbi:MAG: hypothetical protein JW828_07855 [Sedimentisphaerales bacterium]|nr:hypothetical protein [Sedimentisphaerales bacterium]
MKTRIALVAIGIVGCLIVNGCQQPFNIDREVFERYGDITLKISRSQDVLTALTSDQETLIQSGNVILSVGQREKSNHLWFNAVAFDEQELTATAKYGMGYERYAPSIYINPEYKMRLDLEMVAPKDLLSEPYSTENARRIAVLTWAFETCKSDLAKGTGESQDLAGAVLLVNQTIRAILYTLQSSPGLASRLSEPAGMTFDQINLGIGHIRMLLKDDIVKIKVKAGQGSFKDRSFEDHPDVMEM